VRISIVTPSFNQAEFIEQTINSVLSQSYSDIEYVIVDGGSTDGSVAIIERFRDLVDHVIIEQDEGQADSINKGFSRTAGDICGYLNSDDYYFVDTVATVSRYFSEDPALDMIYGDCVLTDENGQFLRYFSEISDFDTEKLLNYSDFIMQHSAFWRRSAYQKFGPFNKRWHYGFDWGFWCELARNGCRIKRVPEILSASRVYDQTKTLSGSEERLSELRDINRCSRTRLLSHAYCRYRVSEFMKKPAITPGALLMPLYALLSYKFLQEHIRNYSSKIIYGHLPRQPYLMKQAGYRMPRLRFTSTCEWLSKPALIW
jgi:glycosyltransferase involved in cell wall biosynthesis